MPLLRQLRQLRLESLIFMSNNLSTIIESAFEKRSEINNKTIGEIRDAVTQTLNLLDLGQIRI